ncbi:MAG: DNA-invertase hin [Lentisphaerae bacterium ADurb.BinA184]|nr:MAG: DNA-invertase hin [Lentisphaerae bacterium ADurb.BinA184]
MTGPKPTVRCAVYTRKSTDEGLDQAFNSLDAQRLAAENYIASQAGEGWVCLPERYDDGGYTGGNTDRPALQRLLVDVRAGRVDCVLVYKVDRLSRSLLDFARVMGVFEEHGTSFVSVTQSFNSANSMGRLTLNILLSFAQFEREVISERTRDKIHMARQQGRWSGGCQVLGYDAAPGGGGLVVNAAEAEKVRTIFALYLELGGLLKVIEELDRRGWTNKTWVTRGGRLHQGKPFVKNVLYALLTNPLYTGRVRHQGKVYPGRHEAIVDDETFAKVQRLLARNGRHAGDADMRFRGQAILQGILRCRACDCGMVNSHSRKGNRRYRYYLCHHAHSRGWRHCPRPTLPAEQIERFVVEEIRAIGQDAGLVREVVEETRRSRDREAAELATRERLLVEELAGYERQAQSLASRPGEPATVAGLAAIQERVSQIAREAADVHGRLANLRAATPGESEIVEACRLFDPLWDTLTSREQHRILHLLIERVEYDAAEETISITFHPTGIQALNAGRRCETEEATAS